MRILRGSLLCLCLPLLMAAALADTVPDATLRLVPTGEIAPDAPLRLPQTIVAPPAAAATPVAAQPPPQSQPMSFGPQKLAFPGNVSATFDLVYGSLKGFRPLTLDIYQPPARNTALPLVVFVHGGGWNGGDTRHAASFPDFPRVLAGLAARGYVVASVSYRLSGEARFPAAVQDVKAAIRWLRGHSRDLNVDPTRVAVWGDAAGGQLAALTGVTCGVAPFEPDAKDNGQLPSDCVQAVIDWGGASELESLGAAPVEGAKPAPTGFTAPPTSDAGDFLGCEPARCAPMLARLASPLAFISATSPAFLIQHGGADTLVPSSQSQKVYDALRKAGASAELVVYPGIEHGFTRGGAPDAVALQAVQDKLAAFLAQTFPATPLGPRLAQPRGSLY
jgi:acetyl esterase/lipase